MGITPNVGPTKGGSKVDVNVTGLAQKGICEIILRMGTFEFTPKLKN